MKAEQVAKIVEESQQHFTPCILCKAPTKCRGIFVPKERNTLTVGEASSEKQTRIVVYALCELHQKTQETWDEVESYFLKEKK